MQVDGPFKTGFSGTQWYLVIHGTHSVFCPCLVGCFYVLGHTSYGSAQSCTFLQIFMILTKFVKRIATHTLSITFRPVLTLWNVQQYDEYLSRSFGRFTHAKQLESGEGWIKNDVTHLFLVFPSLCRCFITIQLFYSILTLLSMRPTNLDLNPLNSTPKIKIHLID